MKFIDIIGSATSNMLRSKVRTILTIIAIVIGAFTITLTVGISSGVSDYIDKQLGAIGAEDVLIIQPKVEVNQSSGPQKYDPEQKANTGQAAFISARLTDADLKEISSQDGLSDVEPSLLIAADYVSGKNGEQYTIDVQQTIQGMNVEYVAGGDAVNSDNTPLITLPVSYVKPLGFNSSSDAVGSNLTIGITTPFGEKNTVIAKVSGVQQESILTQGGAFANTALANELYALQTQGLPAESANQYFSATARFDTTISPEQLQGLKDDLDEKGFSATTVADQIGIVKNIIDAITAVLIFFGAIALLAASFGIINTLYMSVQERTKEIGLMKAMGMSRAKVFLLFSVEALLLGFWGSFIGIIAAIGVGQVANKIATENFLKGLPGFDLTVFPLMSLAVIMAIIMLIAFLAGTLPARRAAKQDPINALRYE